MTDTRARLAELLGQPLPDAWWDAVQRDGSLGWLAEVDAGAWTLEDVAMEIRRLLAPAGTGTAKRAERAPSRSFSPAAFARARGVVDARHARNDPLVQAFRDDVMAGQAIEPHAVVGWIEARSSNARGSAGELHYAAPEDLYLRRILVAEGSDLDRLRRLSEQLAARYSWQPVQATSFVLADVVPVVAPIRTYTRWKNHGGSRVTVVAEVGVPPAEVAKAFARAVGGHFGRRSALSEKHCSLAVFLAERLEPPSSDERQSIGATPGNWDGLRREWNAEHPGWRYSERSNFQRDATSALERLLAA